MSVRRSTRFQRVPLPLTCARRTEDGCRASAVSAYFFPRPAAGSACKRLNLFLRWMVRRDEIDLGVWSQVSPARLIVPLDTHVIRLGRCLKLTRYTSPGWKMALDITNALRAFELAGSGSLRFRAVPRRDDERLWLSEASGQRAVPPARLVRSLWKGSAPLDAKEPLVDRHRAVDHVLHSKQLARACQAGFSHARSLSAVLQQRDDALGEGLMIARGN